MNKAPYVGLRPFQANEHELFFGRENCINDLLGLLETTPFFAVVGEAYCGKTSLIRCGLEARLVQNNKNDNLVQWHIANFRPYSTPFLQMTEALLKEEALGESLLEGFESKTQAQRFLRQNLMQSLSLHSLLDQKPLAKGHKLLLVCDQFEDIFHLWKHDEKKAHTFVDFLIDSSRPHPIKAITPNNIHVVLTFRSRYLNKIPLFSKLEAALKQNLYLTPHLTKDELRQVMIEPIQVIKRQRAKEAFLKESQVNQKPKAKSDDKKVDTTEEINQFYKNLVAESNEKSLENIIANEKKNNNSIKKEIILPFSPKLAEHLLENIKNTAEQLPLLQYLLMRIWDVGCVVKTHHLTLDVYKKQRIHSFETALPRHLDETYYSLKEDQLKIAELLFRQLTTVKESSIPKLLHSPIRLNDIAQLTERSIDEVIEVIEVFRQPERGFLIPLHPQKLEADTLIEISHDVIVYHWPRLKDWIKKEKKVKQNYQQLDHLTHEHNEKGGSLLKSSQLDTLWHWSKNEEFNEIWASHYGCNFKNSQHYLLKSKLHASLLKYVALLLIAGVSIGIIFGLIILNNKNQQKEKVLDVLYVMKKELVTKNNSPKLEQLFKKFTDNSPNNAKGWLYYGLSLSYQEKREEAEIAFRKAREISPNDSEVLLHLAKQLIPKKEWEEALFLLNTARVIAPANIEILEMIGDVLIHNDLVNNNSTQKINLETAVIHYREALIISPINDQILTKLGQALSLLNKHVEALTYLNQAVAINKERAENWRLLGFELMHNGENHKASQAFVKALGIEPNKDENWRNAGLALAESGDLKKAAEAFEKAVMLNKRYDGNYRNLGNIYSRLNQLSAALKAYNNAQLINPSKINLIQKAKLLTKLKKIKEANALYQKASAIKDANWD
ncbi:MAG: hypothetical protein Q9M50_03535 [Methylococcales bacterium]|nr:hypothetical protein [Methylococcales bacterium]